MDTTIFKINYNEFKKEENINKETSLFLLDNFLRFQFILETKMPDLFHEYKEDIENSLIFLGKFYENRIKLDKPQNKEIMNDIIFKVHQNLEEITKNTKINEKKFSKWLKNKKVQ